MIPKQFQERYFRIETLIKLQRYNEDFKTKFILANIYVSDLAFYVLVFGRYKITNGVKRLVSPINFSHRTILKIIAFFRCVKSCDS